MSNPPTFLSSLTPRPIKLSEHAEFIGPRLYLGRGDMALEVVVAQSQDRPRPERLRSAWKARVGGRATPVLLVLLHGDHASVCGATGLDAPVRMDLDVGQVERLCQEALAEPDRHAALRALGASLPSVESELAGIRNEGFLADHALIHRAPLRDDWESAGTRGRSALGRRGRELLNTLGFRVERLDAVTSLLKSQDDQDLALAVLLNEGEVPEIRSDRFTGLSPVSYALSVASRKNLPFVVVTHGSKLRIYPTRLRGVGQRGVTETLVECHTGLLRDRDAALLWLLFSAEALAPDGSLVQLLEDSGRFASDLAKDLRTRIYERVVPALAMGIAHARALEKPSASQLAETYEMTMLVLFRLMFVAYAEDKDLLPYRWNGLYQRRSLKTKAKELLETRLGGTGFGNSTSRWEEVVQLWKAVDKGNREWGVPPYDGGLFSSDPHVSPAGHRLTEIELTDDVFGPALTDLLLADTAQGPGPVDFRSLGVREFGTVYEGLLQSELSVATRNLCIEPDGSYRPCARGETPVVASGEIYLHDRSGARKASGSYYTKDFAVDHLLDWALEPALEEHLGRIDALQDTEAAERFFDFRVADIAMGSGHFLVAAVDRIERALSGYLSRRPLAGVAHELAHLRAAAQDALAGHADQVQIEDAQLLRRLIARRCIYGVDKNPMSVRLARLSIWIHTFVPGLPLSLLDHNLVQGDALAGIGTVEELQEELSGHGEGAMFAVNAEALLGDATEPLLRLARVADATPKELERARKAYEEALDAVAPAKALCDVAAGHRLDDRAGGGYRSILTSDWEKLRRTILDSPALNSALRALSGVEPLHFPTAFPEVFLRDRSGFDVILGNPPWEEATLEEDAFWARHFPGMRSLPQREQEETKRRLRKERKDLESLYQRELGQAAALRKALTAGPYPGMGTGDPDLYKAFCWRFWNLVTKDKGHIGVVLPRSALSAKGSADFREQLFSRASNADITTLLNRAGWVFDEAEHRYTIGLVAITRDDVDRTRVALRGPYPSLNHYTAGIVREPAVFHGDEIASWNESAALPLLPTDESVEVFLQLRKAPRLDLDDGHSWRARPHTELHATNDKPYMDLESKTCPDGFWPVFKGGSFDIWQPDTGRYYAWADPNALRQVLQDKRLRGARNRRSAFSECDRKWLADPATLPCLSPRIAFRDVTRATDSRTVRAALVPGNVFLANQSPYVLWPRGGTRDEAFLLGILCSLPLDWYARRFIETHLNFHILNPFPVPRPSRESELWQRTVSLAGRLAASDERFADWARSIGVECGPLSPEEQDEHVHELDALVAHAYGLSQSQLTHVFETFHEGWDHGARLESTLDHFKTWKRRL